MEELMLKITAGTRGNRVALAIRDSNGSLVFTDRADLQSSEGRRKAAKAICAGLVAKGYERTPAEVEALLESEWNAHLEAREREAAAESAPAGPADQGPEAVSLRRLAETPDDIRAEAEALLRDPDLIDRITDDIESQGVAGERGLTAALYLVGTSRKLARPLAARVRGPSTSGKSYVVDKVAQLMPPEAVIRATQMSPNALFYMAAGALRHRLIVAGERSRKVTDEAAEATRALREMISAGRLSKLLPVKKGDRLETVLIEQEGPVAFVETTTLGEVFAEDENRCLPLYTDERPEQTRRIITAMAGAYGGESGGGRDPARLRQVHHAAQRMLERRSVVIPFASRIGARLPQERVEIRRAFPALMSMVQAAALLHQFQRAQTDDGCIVATRLDYGVAVTLLTGAMRGLLGGGLSEPAKRFGERLQGWFGQDTFTVQAAARREVHARRSAYSWIAELREAGVVERVSEAAGRTAATYRLTDLDPDRATAFALPSCEEVFGGEPC